MFQLEVVSGCDLQHTQCKSPRTLLCTLYVHRFCSVCKALHWGLPRKFSCCAGCLFSQMFFGFLHITWFACIPTNRLSSTVYHCPLELLLPKGLTNCHVCKTLAATSWKKQCKVTNAHLEAGRSRNKRTSRWSWRGAHPPRWSLARVVLIFRNKPPHSRVFTQGKTHLENFILFF
jgi:hypothetical protein